jgi:hypothetical protein
VEAVKTGVGRQQSPGETWGSMHVSGAADGDGASALLVLSSWDTMCRNTAGFRYWRWERKEEPGDLPWVAQEPTGSHDPFRIF